MSRFAKAMPVTIWEEPVPAPAGDAPSLDMRPAKGMDECHAGHAAHSRRARRRSRADRAQGPARPICVEHRGRLIRWYYTPMMLPFSRHLDAVATVYDCMDELSAFRFAPDRAARSRARTAGAADVVFTGGYSLYEAKKKRHGNVHPFPSSVDRAHFGAARAGNCRSRRPGRHRPPAPRLLRRDRRADRPRAARQGRRNAPRLAAGDGRPGGEDQRGRSAAPSQHPLPRRQELRRAAGLSRQLGRRDDAVRHQRGDPLHLADQDPGISGCRQAGGVDPDQGREAALREIVGRDDRRRPPKQFVEAGDRALGLAAAKAATGWPRSTSRWPT